MLINEGNFHVFVCGITQSGKSTFTKAAMLQFKCPVIYMNIQGERVPKGFVTVYSNRIESAQLLEMVADGLKINFVFADQRRGYDYISGYVLNLLMDAGYDENNPVYVCLDECHLLRGYSLEETKFVSTAGLKKGIRLICVTQRPANCDKTLYTQAFEHYIFFIGQGDSQYMKNKGIDYDFCQSEWKRLGGKDGHGYCYFNGYTLEGRQGIKL